MVWDWRICIGKSDAGLPNISSSHHQLCHLLFHKYREWSVWIANFFLVKITGSTKMSHNIFLFFKFWIPIPFRFPFNWKNPLGYSIAVTFQYMQAIHSDRPIFSGLFFGIGCYLCSVSIITKDIKNDLKLFNENAASGGNRRLTLNHLSIFIQTHSIMKRLSVFRALNFV